MLIKETEGYFWLYLFSFFKTWDIYEDGCTFFKMTKNLENGALNQERWNTTIVSGETCAHIVHAMDAA